MWEDFTSAFIKGVGKTTGVAVVCTVIGGLYIVYLEKSKNVKKSSTNSKSKRTTEEDNAQNYKKVFDKLG